MKDETAIESTRSGQQPYIHTVQSQSIAPLPAVIVLMEMGNTVPPHAQSLPSQGMQGLTSMLKPEQREKGKGDASVSPPVMWRSRLIFCTITLVMWFELHSTYFFCIVLKEIPRVVGSFLDTVTKMTPTIFLAQ